MVEGFTADEILNGGDYRGLALVYIALGNNDIAFSFLEKVLKGVNLHYVA